MRCNFGSTINPMLKFFDKKSALPLIAFLAFGRKVLLLFKELQILSKKSNFACKI